MKAILNTGDRLTQQDPVACGTRIAADGWVPTRALLLLGLEFGWRRGSGWGPEAGRTGSACENAECRGSLGAGQQGWRKAGRTGLRGVWEAHGARWHRLNPEDAVSGRFHFFATKDGCPPELKKPEPNHPPFLA